MKGGERREGETTVEEEEKVERKVRNDADEAQEATDLEGEGRKVEGREEIWGNGDYRGDAGV